MLPIISTLAEHSRVTTDSEALDAYIAGAAAGDSSAFAELYERTGASVYSYSLSVLKNVHDAEDVLHDCFVNIYYAAAGYRTHGKPLAWILTIAKNLCFQKLRERKRGLEMPDEDWAELLSSVDGIPEEDRLLIREGLAMLSDDERQIVILHAVSGFKHREIASFMSKPLATVLSKYRRALAKLKEFYLKGEL